MGIDSDGREARSEQSQQPGRTPCSRKQGVASSRSTGCGEARSAWLDSPPSQPDLVPVCDKGWSAKPRPAVGTTVKDQEEPLGGKMVDSIRITGMVRQPVTEDDQRAAGQATARQPSSQRQSARARSGRKAELARCSIHGATRHELGPGAACWETGRGLDAHQTGTAWLGD